MNYITLWLLVCENAVTVVSAFILFSVFLATTTFSTGLYIRSSDCHIQREVAECVLLKPYFEVCFWVFVFLCWIVFRVLGKAGHLRKLLTYRYVQVFLVAYQLFSNFCLFVGLGVAIGKFNAMITECPSYDQEWNKFAFILVFVLTIIDCVSVILFVLFHVCNMTWEDCRSYTDQDVKWKDCDSYTCEDD